MWTETTRPKYARSVQGARPAQRRHPRAYPHGPSEWPPPTLSFGVLTIVRDHPMKGSDLSWLMRRREAELGPKSGYMHVVKSIWHSSYWQ